MRPQRRSGGFTLFELMVAIAIFAVLGVMTWSAMGSMVRQQQQASGAMERFREVQRGMTMLTRDLEQIRPRPVRGASHGDMRPALQGGDYLEMPLELTRGGVRNPLSLPRPSLQRVGYRLEGGVLTRYSWPILDRAPDTQAITLPLLEDVTAFNMRFLGPEGEWQDIWPPASAGMNADPFLMPRAVEILIETEDWGQLRRLVDIAGVPPTGEREVDGGE